MQKAGWALSLLKENHVPSQPLCSPSLILILLPHSLKTPIPNPRLSSSLLDAFPPGQVTELPVLYCRHYCNYHFIII